VDRAPEVELLWWRGCPSAQPAIELVREEMERLGLASSALSVREVRDQADAERERFVGSPTIRVDGRDMQDPGDEPLGLTCRVYRLADGRVSALPDRADVSAALAAAIEHQEDEDERG
jgi:hypothetical protein